MEQIIRTITITLSTDDRTKDEITVNFDEPETGDSSRIIVPYSPDEHPEFNERVGNELYWWIDEWMNTHPDGDAKDMPTTERIFTGKKSGDRIVIQRYGRDDYGAYWHNGDFSVRGTMMDIMKELEGEI